VCRILVKVYVMTSIMGVNSHQEWQYRGHDIINSYVVCSHVCVTPSTVDQRAVAMVQANQYVRTRRLWKGPFSRLSHLLLASWRHLRAL
jgi:hypothetical protein